GVSLGRPGHALRARRIEQMNVCVDDRHGRGSRGPIRKKETCRGAKKSSAIHAAIVSPPARRFDVQSPSKGPPDPGGGFLREECMRGSIGRLWGGFCLAILLITPSLAQLDTGTITVTVKDPSGSAVPGASVTLRNENTAIAVRSGAANEQGVFTAALIPSGS